jgi:cbb3-type cytochrome oxidase maturation protein
MSVLYVALPIALLLGGSALLACIYCIRQGQYDDLDTPAVRILIDDPKRPVTATNTQDNSKDLTESLT